jgi:hypothetical protein
LVEVDVDVDVDVDVEVLLWRMEDLEEAGLA